VTEKTVIFYRDDSLDHVFRYLIKTDFSAKLRTLERDKFNFVARFRIDVLNYAGPAHMEQFGAYIEVGSQICPEINQKNARKDSDCRDRYHQHGANRFERKEEYV